MSRSSSGRLCLGWPSFRMSVSRLMPVTRPSSLHVAPPNRTPEQKPPETLAWLAATSRLYGCQ